MGGGMPYDDYGNDQGDPSEELAVEQFIVPGVFCFGNDLINDSLQEATHHVVGEDGNN